MSNRDLSLNIVLTYPVKWSAYNILRDYVQNFYDAVRPEEWMKAFRYEYSRDEHRLIMEIDRNGFSYEWLMHIGASSKTDSEDPHAGYFGEGFKIASLCAFRDYGWGIRMLSRDWELTVKTMSEQIDGREVSVLAYHIEDEKPEMKGSRLEISNVSPYDYNHFRCAFKSFYYPDNELLGKKICKTESFSVYERSAVPVDREFPTTREMEGDGIVYCGFQVMGSIPIPLVLCLHKYDGIDRDRNTLYAFQVIDIALRIACQMPPFPAIAMLERLKHYWYKYPRKKRKISVEEWGPVVNALIRRIRLSAEATKIFCRRHPNLLCAARPVGKKEQQQRHQALIWKRQQGRKYTLVKDAFSLLGYQFLEEACRENGGISDDIREPNKTESKCSDLMESLAGKIYEDFFGTMTAWPPIWIMDHPSAVCLKMGDYERIKEGKRNKRGNTIRYRLDRIALGRELFGKDRFLKAFSSYIHELCHAFGGDASERCSNAMTIALDIMLSHRREVMDANESWNRILAENYE